MTTWAFDGRRFDAASGELTSPDGAIERLQPQPAQVLELLLERAGTVVPRDDIVARVWPDTKVEFDQAVNFAVRQIRAALGESATEPRVLETLPRRGYRIIVPVERVGGERAGPEAAGAGSAAAGAGASAGGAAPVARERDAATGAGGGAHGGTGDGDDGNGGEGDGREGASARHGEEGDGDADDGEKPSRQPSRFLRIALVVVVGVAGWWAGQRPRAAEPAAGADDAPVVAVQVLRHDTAADGGTEALRLAEDLTAALTRAAGDALRVVGPATTAAYGTNRAGYVQLRGEVGAAFVVGGSVDAASSEGVFVELIDARDGRHVWAMRFQVGEPDVAGRAADSVVARLRESSMP